MEGSENCAAGFRDARSLTVLRGGKVHLLFLYLWVTADSLRTILGCEQLNNDPSHDNSPSPISVNASIVLYIVGTYL